MNWTGTNTQRVINNKHTLAVAHTHTKFNCIALIMQSEFLDNLCDAMSHPTALEIRSGIGDVVSMVGHLHCMEKAVDDGMLCCIMLSSWPKRVDDGAKQDNIGMLFVSRVAPLFGCFSQCILYALLLLVASSVRLGSRCVRD